MTLLTETSPRCEHKGRSNLITQTSRRCEEARRSNLNMQAPTKPKKPMTQ
ncbi:hypothetical protein [Aequorivita soesokkakensis]|nr:hypothetical protein [Aequorivita soesokkakensis]